MRSSAGVNECHFLVSLSIISSVCCFTTLTAYYGLDFSDECFLSYSLMICINWGGGCCFLLDFLFSLFLAEQQVLVLIGFCVWFSNFNSTKRCSALLMSQPHIYFRCLTSGIQLWMPCSRIKVTEFDRSSSALVFYWRFYAITQVVCTIYQSHVGGIGENMFL